MSSDGLEELCSKGDCILGSHGGIGASKLARGDHSLRADHGDVLAGIFDSGELESLQHVDGIVQSSDGLSVLESIRDRGQDNSSLRDLGDVRTSSNKDDGVKDDTLSGSVQPGGLGRLSFGIRGNVTQVRSDDKDLSSGSLEGRGDGSVLSKVELGSNDEGNATGLDGVGSGTCLQRDGRGLLGVSISLKLGGRVHSNCDGNLLGHVEVDLVEEGNDSVSDSFILDVGNLKLEGLNQMLSLPLGKRVEKESSLLEVLSKLGSSHALSHALDSDDGERVSVVLGVGNGIGGSGCAESVGPVVGLALVDRHSVSTVSLVVSEGADRTVDGDLLPVGASQSSDLSVLVRKVSSLEQGIIAGLDSGNQMSGAVSDLLSLGKVVVWVSIESHLSNLANGDQLFGDDLGRVQDVKVKLVLITLLDDLDTQLPLGVVSSLDGIPKISSQPIGIGTLQLDRLVPGERVGALNWLPVELDESSLALSIDQDEGVDSKTLDGSVRSGESSVGEGPHEHVSRFGNQRNEVPKVVVSCLSLGHLLVGLGLDGVNQIGELDGVLDEEDGNVVTNDVKVALISVKFDGKSSNVSDSIGRSLGASHSRKSHEDGGLLGWVSQEIGLSQVVEGFIHLEKSVSSISSGMNGSLRDSLVVKVRDLLPQMEILQQGGSSGSCLQRCIGVVDLGSPVGGNGISGSIGHSVDLQVLDFSALSERSGSISDGATDVV